MSDDSWKTDLETFFQQHQFEEDAEEKKAIANLQSEQKEQEAAATFYKLVAKPAFDKIAMELRKHGRRVQVNITDNSAHIRVEYGDHDELNLALRSRGQLVYTVERFTHDGKAQTREGFLDRAFNDTFANTTQGKIINYTLTLYKDNVRRLR